MSYCDKHIPLDGCIPGDEVTVHRDEECTECVREERDRLRSMIVAWCRDHKWCASAWKHEPTNMALFEEAGKEVDQ